MLHPLALAMAAVVASTASSAPHRTLTVQLIHRCAPDTTCLTSRIVALMKTEAERVWCRSDVRLAWVDPRRVAAPRRAGLIVMLEEGSYQGPPADADSVLAALSQPSDTCGWGLVHVWARHVERHAALLMRGTHAVASLPPALADMFLGRALGRALAHEIGHYLLGTREHARHGLMRAQFAPYDLLEDAAGPLYGLDSRQHAALMSCRTDQQPGPDRVH